MNALHSFKIQNGDSSLAAQASFFIKNLIARGVLKDGEKLPNEAELAGILKISRMTARESLMNLVQQGLLHRHVGRGTFVCARGMVPKILWACGKDIMNEDLSPYYSAALRLFSKACMACGWQATPLWIGDGDEAAISSYLPSRNGDYTGYLFLSTPPSHPLLRAVEESKLPYVHITSTPGKSKFISADLEQGIILGIDHLRKANPEAAHVTMLCQGIFEDRIRRITSSLPGVQVKLIFRSPSPIMSEAIVEGYETMRGVMESGQDWSSLFIMDDVMALGATEAILKAKGVNLGNVHLLVSGGGSLQIPFPNPVKYLYYDITEEASTALRILQDQISGRDLNPPGCYGKFSLVDSNFIGRKT